MPLKQRHSIAPHLDLSSFGVNKNTLSAPLTSGHGSGGSSPLTPRSPKSSPTSPFLKDRTIRSVTEDTNVRSDGSFIPVSSHVDAEPLTPSLPVIPQYPPFPKESPKHNRNQSRSFFGNLKAPKSSHRNEKADNSGNFSDHSKGRGNSKDRRTLASSKLYGSTPDLPGTVEQAEQQEKRDAKADEKEDNESHPSESKTIASDSDSTALPLHKKNKSRFGGILSRSRSIRVDESGVNRLANRRPSITFTKIEETSQQEMLDPPQTAPPRSDRPAKHIGNLGTRNQTVDCLSELALLPSRKEKTAGTSMVTSASFSHVSGALFSNIKQTSSGAADRIGKAGKGLFGKITRSGSTIEREMVTDDNYVCTVINLPLIEQTRRTRIAKRIEECRDKTEFWMPALPYRCIDYLNFKGCEEEGLYRIPGSGREVKHWQRRFDTEFDINLFDVPDLYDINIVGSMFKAWLRELPDELFPKQIQGMIAEKCQGATTAPQMLKDELSKLPPYNYYLLFAITCHLNLLHSYVDQNRMDYRNLCICFQPSMKIDAFCFQFLVCDWKNCWQGCWTEKEYLQKEKEMDELEATRFAEESNFYHLVSGDNERAISSSGSSDRGEEEAPRAEPSKGRKKPRPSNLDDIHNRSISHLPELGPPLSPIRM